MAVQLPQTGGCLCGRIRYEISAAPQLVYTCHCLDCQHLTGGAFSMAIVVSDAAFRLAGIAPRPLRGGSSACSRPLDRGGLGWG